MSDTYTVSPVQHLKRVLLRSFVTALFKLLFKVKISGMENIPVGEVYVIASNHVSHYEPPLLLGFWPEFAEPLIVTAQQPLPVDLHYAAHLTIARRVESA